MAAALLTARPGSAQKPPAPAPTAAANTPTPAEKDEARALARKAIELYEAGKFADALDLFGKANALYRTPQGQLYVARCNARLGRLVLARDLYTDLVFTPPPAGASQNVRDAHAAAQTELDALRPRIPLLTIVLKGGDPADLDVTIDGAVASGDLAERGVDPGQHVIQVRKRDVRQSLPGGAPGLLAERTITAVEGQRVKVEIDLKGPQPGPTASSPPGAAPAPFGAGRAVSLVIAGVGLIGIGVGVGAGVTALGKAGEIKAGCDPQAKLCPASLEPTYRDAQALGTVSTIGFIAGGAALATGAVLFFVLPRGAAPPATGLRVRPGLASLTIEGAF
jgi:hypothetical protein